MPAETAAPEVLLARQPICTAALATAGYELLFRDAHVDVASVDATAATSRVIVGAMADAGLDALIGPHKAWINVPAGFVDAFDELPLPPSRVVLEVLETVDITPQLLDRLRVLRAEGFGLAADDYVLSPEREPLLGVVDYVKLDVRALGADGLEEHVRLLRPYGVELVAEKVETPEEFAHARDLGCTLFQGWFYCKPDLVHGVRIPTRGPGSLSAIAQIATGQTALEDLERIVSLDAGLSMRLLRLLNSAAIGARSEVRTVRHALSLLGERPARQWLVLVLLADLAPVSHPLLETAIIRGRACELLAREGGGDLDPADAFTAGLFSVADALMGASMEEALAQLPLAAATKAALVDGTGPAGRLLTAVRACERDGAQADPEVTGAYVHAARWAGGVLRGVA